MGDCLIIVIESSVENNQKDNSTNSRIISPSWTLNLGR